MKPRANWVVVATLLPTILLSLGSAIGAQQGSTAWNQWRGGNRDGVGDAAALPPRLPAELTRVWQVPVGEGHASPIFVGDTVFLHSREGEQEVARALSLADGSEIWRQAYDAPYTMNSAARAHGPGPKSTPVYADGRLFTFGISGILSAFSTDDGGLLWQHDFTDQFPVSAPIYGVSMSPIVVGDVVVAHTGGDEAGALTAFDVVTGEPRWSNTDFTPGYASPIAVEIEGTRFITTQSDRHIIVIDAETGTTLWSMPFATDFQQNAVTPLAYGEHVVYSGLDMDLFAVSLRPGGGGESRTGGWEAEELWRNDRLPLHMSSPVRLGYRMFGMSHKRAGQFICIDLNTGATVWTSRGREGENAAIVVLGDRVAFLTNEARLVFVDVYDDAYEPLAEYEVAETATWAHPAFTPRGVLIKDLDTLALWSF